MPEHIDKEELFSLIKEAISQVAEAHPLSQEEIQWVRMAIEAEAQKKAFRQAVIDKTLIGLFSAGLLWIGSKIIELVMSHWK